MVIGGSPLNFLLRGHGVVTAEQLLAKYANINTDLSISAARKGKVQRSKQVALSVVETADQRLDAPFNLTIPKHHGWPFGIHGN
jgi:hypothetical protein